MATSTVLGSVDVKACDDAAECKLVENIITILTHYHYWNEQQLQESAAHDITDYSSLLPSDHPNPNEDDDDEDAFDDTGTGTDNKLKTIHPQLTKSSASIRHVPKYGSIISEFMDNEKYNGISLLNDFDHVLDKHCEDDREFEWIYKELTGENEVKSVINKSNNILHRHHYSRDALYRDIELIKKLYYGHYESKQVHDFEILDKIYIHFLHSYDFGFRLEPFTKLAIISEEETRLKLEAKSEENPEINIDKSLGAITEKLTYLRMKLDRFDTLKSRFNKSNRFVTNYSNAMLLNSEFNAKNEEEIKLNLEDDDGYDMDDSKSNIKLALKARISDSASHKASAKAEMESLQQLATVRGKSNEALEADAHLIGKRWHYSCNIENNTDVDLINGGVSGDWYIPTRYKNIKREMLDNKIFALSMNAWIFNYDYALILMTTDKAKNTVRSVGDRWKTFYDENQNFVDLPSPNVDVAGNDADIFSKPKVVKQQNKSRRITINHVLALLFYCNFHELSRYFRATYIESNERSDEAILQWKNQHSQFANLGRLIRDAVEDYGCSIADRSLKRGGKDCFFYHGIDGHRIIFNTTMIRFCSPISTSRSANMIQMYIDMSSSTVGMVLQCKEYSKYLRFFQSSWLSMHSMEAEHIFCGGDWPLRINSILDVGSVSSYNYRYYLRAINIIQDLIRGEYNHECEYIDNKIKYAFNQIFSSRLWMRDAIPKYVDKLFDKYCDNLGASIEINFEYMNVDCSGYLQIKSSIIDPDQCDRIKFDVLCCVFSNVTIFKFITYKLCKQTFNYLLEFLGEKKHEKLYDSKLKYVIFSSPNETKLTCKNIVKLYQKKYKQINWYIEYKKKDQFGQPVLLICDHKIKMDDCVIM